jgi:septum formation protein
LQSAAELLALGRPRHCARATPRLFHKVIFLALLLASTSPIRRHLLVQAGVDCAIASPDVDEAAVQRAHRGDGPSLALALATAKALSVDRPGDLIVGCDSVLEVDGRLYAKPVNRNDAARHLAEFSGRTMVLSSAVTLARDGAVEWSCVDKASLVVRTLSPHFITSYLDAEWPDVAYCVGVFRMEGRGVTLFERVEGSHFTILGLPLLPLLGALRERGVMAS